MKLLGVTLVVAVANAVAQPHRHAHRHLKPDAVKREGATAGVYVPGPVETVIVYQLNAHFISEDEVRQGIANGTLTWGEDGNLSSSIVAVPAQATSLPQKAPEPPILPHSDKDTSLDEPQSEPQSQPQSAPQAPSSDPAPNPAPQPSDSQPSSPNTYKPVDQDGNCPDCEKEFPNNYFSCDQFPTGYGAIHLGNEGLGGWSGIQDPKQRGAAGYNDIVTVTSGSCPDGSCCTEGKFCSYACPNPYLKQSFPKKQGATGQSVGGLYCNEQGKLEMADGSLSKSLCGKGTSHFKVKVQNKLSEPVSICRTDYPGTESETIPMTVQPGETGELASPDQKAYYFWQGKPTSAQYYINKKGVPESEACTWGSGAKAVGNYAPANLGTSWDDINMNAGYVGLSQNAPTTDAKLDFTVTFTGDGVSNPCKYKKDTQEYCNGDSCAKDKGCTASVAESSTLTVIFTDD